MAHAIHNAEAVRAAAQQRVDELRPVYQQHLEQLFDDVAQAAQAINAQLGRQFFTIERTASTLAVVAGNYRLELHGEPQNSLAGALGSVSVGAGGWAVPPPFARLYLTAAFQRAGQGWTWAYLDNGGAKRVDEEAMEALFHAAFRSLTSA